jgi:3-hydroxy-9,10-secoandrosta-1,3,5(10)-triene-9,17-dione monooxygenase
VRSIKASEGTVESLITKVRELQPLLRENAPLAEQARTMTKDVESALRKIGAFSMMVPTRWGGSGLSMTDYSRVMMEIGAGDLAASWVVQILNTTSWLGSLTSDATQEALFSEGTKLICGAPNPPGRARKVAGGYIVSGKWPYSSGSPQADWMLGSCLIVAEDGTLSPPGNIVFMPMSNLVIEPSWFVTGLQGTGSDTVAASDVFIPDHMMLPSNRSFGYAETRIRHNGAPSDKMPIVAVARTTNLAQLVGGAKTMLALIEADVLKKPLMSTVYKLKAESAVIVHEVGMIAAQLDNAELLLFDCLEKLDRRARSGETWTSLELSRQKAQGAQIINLIHRAIESIMFLGGSSAFALANPIQRYWRDIHMALRHITHIPALGYELYGRDRLQLSPNISPPGAY